MIYEAIERLPARNLVVQCARIEQAARIDAWASSEAIRSYSTHQLQQLRRVARLLARYPWRDSQMRADELLSLTRDLLCDRGAITVQVES